MPCHRCLVPLHFALTPWLCLLPSVFFSLYRLCSSLIAARSCLLIVGMAGRSLGRSLTSDREYRSLARVPAICLSQIRRVASNRRADYPMGKVTMYINGPSSIEEIEHPHRVNG